MIQEIEDRLADHIHQARRYCTEERNLIIRQTNELQIAVFQTAPRELPKLNVQIALKTKAYNLATEMRQRTLLRAELEALGHLRDIVILVNEEIAKDGKPRPYKGVFKD